MNDWERREIAIKFQLSDWVLFSVARTLRCRVINIGQAATAIRDLELPFDALAEDEQGFMVRALPVNQSPVEIETAGEYLFYVAEQYQHCYIDLNTSFADYVRKFSSKTRSTINRKIKKFTEHCGGSLNWKRYHTAAQMREFIALARSVSVLTYQERLLDAGIPDSEAFILEAETLAARDEVRAYLLFDGEKPVSYLYCPVQNDVLIYAYLGYNPEYMKLSVGTVLQWLALEQLFSEGKFKAFDFTEGQSEHKRLFATHQIPCANVLVLKNTLSNRLLVNGQRATNRFSALLGTTLEKLGLKARIKHLLRFAGH